MEGEMFEGTQNGWGIRAGLGLRYGWIAKGRRILAQGLYLIGLFGVV